MTDGMMLGGMRVISNPHISAKRPKIQLSRGPWPSGVDVSDKFRADMDRWLLETFGEEHVVYVISDEALRSFSSWQGPMVVGNPLAIGMIRGLKP